MPNPCFDKSRTGGSKQPVYRVIWYSEMLDRAGPYVWGFVYDEGGKKIGMPRRDGRIGSYSYDEAQRRPEDRPFNFPTYRQFVQVIRDVLGKGVRLKFTKERW